MIHTNRCKHCGKTKEEHFHGFHMPYKYCSPVELQPQYLDTGLAALDAHKEELYLALVGYFDGLDNCDIDKERVYEMELRSVLNQIEKEK